MNTSPSTTSSASRDVTSESGSPRWFALDPADVTDSLDVEPGTGLDDGDAADRRRAYGPNEVTTEPAPTAWQIAKGQIANPMNIMLLVVSIVSFVIGQASTGTVVGLLVTFNVVMGTNQERKAMASVDALADLQVPTARVRRGGSITEIDAVDVVPGDIVLVEAGDMVPADARIVTSASLEVQEAALTGESAPVAKDPLTLPDEETPLGDRTNLVFQNTQVTRGSAEVVVVATGARTRMGRIADMVTATTRTKSPLQRELDDLTKVFGILAWAAVAVIAIAGIVRGSEGETLLLLCVSTAISAIPTGLPTFVQLMLSSGAQRLAEAEAVVKSLNDVETLGATTVINSDKTGTLTMNAMTAVTMLTGGAWYQIDGSGYTTTGAIRGPAGEPAPDFTRLALGLALCSDATVASDETIIGDPTEAALVVLAAKVGIDAEETRRTVPRRALVPFDSQYKFMATFHDVPAHLLVPDQPQSHFASVKGAPDVVISRCSHAAWHGEVVPIEQVSDELLSANRQLSERGLRVLAFAARGLAGDEMAAAVDDPMAAVDELVLVSLVGIIDPLRPSAVEAVATAHRAGIDVRMITGDHTITARAIADELGLGAGVITGTDLADLSDAEVIEQLPDLHVFGRVAPEDKVRLARLMQESGDVVAMTGDAVNDAAALKQADIGVAMGSGSEVTKQAGRLILTNDNFGTLVHAVDLGRDIYRRISSYVKLQLTILSSVLQLMLLATILDINEGVALFPMQLLFAKFFVVATVVVGMVSDVPDPGVMQRPPRTPGSKIATRAQTVRWAVSGLVVAGSALALLAWGPDEPSTTEPSVAMTMAFAVVALSTVNMGVVLRRERQAPWSEPLFPFFGWVTLGWSLTVAAIEVGFFQRLLETTALSGSQWFVVIGVSLLAPLLIGVDRWLELRRDTPSAARSTNPVVSTVGQR